MGKGVGLGAYAGGLHVAPVIAAEAAIHVTSNVRDQPNGEQRSHAVTSIFIREAAPRRRDAC